MENLTKKEIPEYIIKAVEIANRSGTGAIIIIDEDLFGNFKKA